jgi:hypothetical protein
MITEWAEILETASGNGVRVYFQDFDYISNAIVLRAIITDGLLAVGSFVFVFCVLIVGTRSLFLASVGLFEIFISLPMAQFLYSYLFGFESTTVLNFLVSAAGFLSPACLALLTATILQALFVVAGVGADDIFVWVLTTSVTPVLFCSHMLTQGTHAFFQFYGHVATKRCDAVRNVTGSEDNLRVSLRVWCCHCHQLHDLCCVCDHR